jgi:ATP/maltotriose-dependent transcriptional regulator MalT
MGERRWQRRQTRLHSSAPRCSIPGFPGDLIPRRRLLDRLHAGSSRTLMLISAQAGAGVTTLLAHWLADAECFRPSAWLSLDEHDNDLNVFVSYLIGAVRTVFRRACARTFDLLRVPQAPPLHVRRRSSPSSCPHVRRRSSPSSCPKGAAR